MNATAACGTAAAAARAILADRLGAPDAEPRAQGGGLTNQVFRAETRDGPVVLRLGRAERKGDAFEREARVIGHVRTAGVPAPEVLDCGRREDWAYMISRALAGAPAVDHPKRLEVLRALGQLVAERIHSLATVGCGHDFGWPGEPPTQPLDWPDWLDSELAAEARLSTLRRHAVISEAQHAALLATLTDVRRWRGAPILNHGDLRLKNVMVDEAGAIQGLIDWETSLSVLGSYWDLSVGLHDLSVDQKQAFLDGYGLPPIEIRRAAPVWRLFNALNYAPELERLLAAGDTAAIVRLRTRFSGALDLYGA